MKVHGSSSEQHAATTAPAVDCIDTNLRDLKDIGLLLPRIYDCRSRVKDWCSLESSLTAINEILQATDVLSRVFLQQGQDLSRAQHGAYTLFHRYASLRDMHFNAIMNSLKVFDWELSRDKHRITPKAGVSETLDEYREMYDKIDNLFYEISAKLILKYGAEKAKDMVPSYLPSIGFVLLVRSNPSERTMRSSSRMSIGAKPSSATSRKNRRLDSATTNCDDLPADFELQFKQVIDAHSTLNLMNFEKHTSMPADKHSYRVYKCNITNQLDHTCGDIFALITKLEQKIYLELEETVRANVVQLNQALNACAEVDCLLSLAEVSKDLNYCRPTFNEDWTISIQKLRHPLLEHSCEDSYIPNDIVHSAGTFLHSMQSLSGASHLYS